MKCDDDHRTSCNGSASSAPASAATISAFLHDVRRQPIIECPEDDEIYRSMVYTAKPWSRCELERMPGVTIPDQLAEFWDECGSMELLIGTNIGWLGLWLWPASEVGEYTRALMRDLPPEKFRRGDLALGLCHGIGDDLVIRCDKELDDFGNIVVLETLNGREEWPRVGRSLLEFLQRYSQARRWFWRE